MLLTQAIHISPCWGPGCFLPFHLRLSVLVLLFHEPCSVSITKMRPPHFFAVSLRCSAAPSRLTSRQGPRSDTVLGSQLLGQALSPLGHFFFRCSTFFSFSLVSFREFQPLIMDTHPNPNCWPGLSAFLENSWSHADWGPQGQLVGQ